MHIAASNCSSSQARPLPWAAQATQALAVHRLLPMPSSELQEPGASPRASSPPKCGRKRAYQPCPASAA
jgi:hypothetical protein